MQNNVLLWEKSLGKWASKVERLHICNYSLSFDHFPLTVLGDHPGQCGILVRLEMLRLGLLSSGHAAAAAAASAAGVSARGAACADLMLMCPRCADASAKGAKKSIMVLKKKTILKKKKFRNSLRLLESVRDGG